MTVSSVFSAAGLGLPGALSKSSPTAPFCIDALINASQALPGIDVGFDMAKIPQVIDLATPSERQLSISTTSLPDVPTETAVRNELVEHRNSAAARPDMAGAAAWNVQNNFDLGGLQMKVGPNGSSDEIIHDETPTDPASGILPLPTILMPQAQAIPHSTTAAVKFETDAGEPLLLRASGNMKAALPSFAIEAKTVAAQPVELLDAPGAMAAGPLAPNAPDLLNIHVMQAFSTDKIFNGHLNLEQDALWIDDLAREIVAFGNEQGRLRFGLSPKGLGYLEVAIDARPHGVDITLATSTDGAARIFAAEQSRLVDELRQSGVRLIHSDLVGGQSSSQRQNAQPDQYAQLAGNDDQHSPKGDAGKIAWNEPRAGRFA